MPWRMPVLLFVLWMLVSCASLRPPRQDPAEINWRERVGVYTYRQARADFGTPANVIKSPEGLTAEWLLRPHPGTEPATGSGFAGSQSASTVGTSPNRLPQGEKLRLKFGPDGKLIE